MWQIAIVCIIYLPLVILTGHYLFRVTMHKKTWLDPLMDKVIM
ncbi:Potassium-transporting ATPase potassium-binding subunit OS=Lysinibacillus sphaericus OX=1421 GN=kdpA PE=3 SV=1 [Lysinibacillus sphaericus]